MSRNSEQKLLTNLSISIKEHIAYKLEAGDYADFDRDQVIEDCTDAACELIDGELPIYYSDMAQLLAENTGFGSVDDEGLLKENPSVWDIITTSIYEWMSSEYYDLACDAVDELIPDFTVLESAE